jgi:calcium-dependent protein kinase
MGVDMSRDLKSLALDIPSSLRPIQPFLYDAQRGIINLQKPQNEGSVMSRKKVVVHCVNHGIRLLNILNLDLDTEAKNCIANYKAVRDRFVTDLRLDRTEFPEPNDHVPGKPAFPSHEILIAEADEVLALAEELGKEGFRFESSFNFHTACVYYRVMESMIPSLAGHVHQRLMYAAWRARLSSSLSHNFIREYFEGQSCADVYEVHGSSKLGKGSYGSVYLATHRVTGDERAVKVMNVERVTSYYLRKLHTEIEILKAVDHPNIIKLKDVFFGKRSVYLITDLCRGGELFELLNSGKNQGFVFREDRASRLMRDMTSAVHYLHSRGIVHRDLKLENFLFEAKNSNSPLILIDFGLSKHFEPEERLSQRVGSCYYTAPDVLNGNYDHRCDVWSLGVLCYMLLSGSPPFHGNTVEEVYQSTLTKEAVFPEKKFRHISPACMDFMRRMLIKDANLRITTAQALAHPFISGDYMGDPRNSTSLSSRMGLPGTAPAPPLAGAKGDAGTKTLQRLSEREADDILASICVFVSADPLAKLMLIMAAHQLPSDHLTDLRWEFQRIDADHSGTISLPELTAALMPSKVVARGEVDMGAAYAALCIESSHGHGTEMTYHEYIAAAMCRRIDIDETRMRLAYQTLDGDEQGYIGVDAIRKSLGDDIPTEVLDAMISVGDPNGQGFVSEPAFMTHWRSLNLGAATVTTMDEST